MGKLGVFLIILSFVTLAFGIVPLFVEGKEPFLNIMEPILCAPGENLTMEVVVTHHYDGTGYSGDFDCHRPNETSYDVTGKAFLLGAASFTVPFLIGLVMSIRAFNHAVRGVIPTNPAHYNTGWGQPSVSTTVSNAFHSMNTPTAGNTELTQRLKQLRDAYDAGMISHEEYERTRADLLKDFANVG